MTASNESLQTNEMLVQLADVRWRLMYLDQRNYQVSLTKNYLWLNVTIFTALTALFGYGYDREAVNGAFLLFFCLTVLATSLGIAFGIMNMSGLWFGRKGDSIPCASLTEIADNAAPLETDVRARYMRNVVAAYQSGIDDQYKLVGSRAAFLRYQSMLTLGGFIGLIVTGMILLCFII